MPLAESRRRGLLILPRSRRAPLLLAICLAAASAVALGALWGTSRDSTRAPHRTTAPMGELVPERGTPNAPDEAPEVQALRQALTAMAWATLQMSCDVPEVETWLHPDFVRDSRFCHSIWWQPGDGVAAAGPPAYEVVESTRQDDGAVEVVTCTAAEPSSRYRVATREPVPGGDHHLLHRYRLSPHGDSYRLTAAQTALLGACEPSGTITVQHFADWQSAPRFTRFFAGLDSALGLDDIATSTTPST